MKNRKEVRNELARIIQAGCPSAVEVISYQKSELSGVSPVIRIISNRTLFVHVGMGIKQVKYVFSVQIIVVYQDPGQPDYTEEQAEDYFDDVHKELVEVLQQIPSGTSFATVVVGESDTTKFVLDGLVYLAELFPIEVTTR